MLQAAGVPFRLIDALLDEEAVKAGLVGTSPLQVAVSLAISKARAATGHEGDLVLGSDQTLELSDGRMLSKPESPAEAAEQLRMMSARVHYLHSAAAIVEGGEIVWSGSETVKMTMRAVSEDFIGRYLELEHDSICWSVGGYRVEGPGVQLFEKIEGSHFAVLGLPLLPLLAFLRGRGVIPS